MVFWRGGVAAAAPLSDCDVMREVCLQWLHSFLKIAYHDESRVFNGQPHFDARFGRRKMKRSGRGRRITGTGWWMDGHRVSISEPYHYTARANG